MFEIIVFFIYWGIYYFTNYIVYVLYYFFEFLKKIFLVDVR